MLTNVDANEDYPRVPQILACDNLCLQHPSLSYVQNTLRRDHSETRHPKSACQTIVLSQYAANMSSLRCRKGIQVRMWYLVKTTVRRI